MASIPFVLSLNNEKTIYCFLLLAISDFMVFNTRYRYTDKALVSETRLNRFNRAISDLAAIADYLEE
jgi:hypothetical protein